jgi:hypothetical protein
MIVRYRQSVKYARQEYGGIKVNIALNSIRKDFKTLCSLGYLLPTNKEKVFLINPMLSYEGLSGRMYKTVQELYQKGDVPKFANEYLKLFK